MRKLNTFHSLCCEDYFRLQTLSGLALQTVAQKLRIQFIQATRGKLPPKLPNSHDIGFEQAIITTTKPRNDDSVHDVDMAFEIQCHLNLGGGAIGKPGQWIDQTVIFVANRQ